jgi:hypothetical protein
MASASVLGLDLFTFILKGHHLGFCKKRFTATWVKLLVM